MTIEVHGVEGLQYRGYCQGFTEVPSNIPSNATAIWVGGNQIKTLHKDTFNYKFCVQLSVVYDEVESIEPGAFNHLDRLQKLYLYKNKIAAIIPGVFDGLYQRDSFDFMTFFFIFLCFHKLFLK